MKRKKLLQSVQQANRRLEILDSVEELTLEMVMMAWYQKLARRVPPGHPAAHGFERGSKLITSHEVVLVLNPEDTSLYLPYARLRYVGPSTQRFHARGLGFLPNTTLYFQGIKTEIVERRESVTLQRKVEALDKVWGKNEMITDADIWQDMRPSKEFNSPEAKLLDVSTSAAKAAARW